MKKILLLILVLNGSFVNGQNLAAYVDNLGYFNVFDNGNSHVITYQAPKTFRVGGNCVAYMDYNTNFKVYYNGNDTTLFNGTVNKFQATHNILLYVIAGQLRVFDRGRVKVLSTWPGDYAVGDSLVAFVDNNYKAFYVYYDHGMFTLENGLSLNPLINFQASNNTLAYINGQREFKIFWNGGVQKIFTLSPGYTVNFQTGSDIVAFLSGSANSLSAFYKGNLYNITNTPVKSYAAADDMVAYEDNSGLHVFSNGRNYDLCSSYSISYEVSDSMLLFYTPGYFRVFNKGKITVLENYMPTEYALDNNTLVYANQQGGLKAFYNGEVYDLTVFDRAAFKLEGNAVWFKSQTSSHKFFLRGKTY